MRLRLTPQTRRRAHAEIDAAPDGHWWMPPVPESASLRTKAKMWAMLADVAGQIEWPVDDVVQRLDAKEWKDIFTSALAQEKRLAAGLRGGKVMLGEHTSDMSQRKMGDLIELMYAFGAEHGVRWSEPGQQAPGWYREDSHA